jgi:hypothetical protein
MPMQPTKDEAKSLSFIATFCISLKNFVLFGKNAMHISPYKLVRPSHGKKFHVIMYLEQVGRRSICVFKS